MKKILCFILVGFSLSVSADIITDTVSLRTMDKITGRVQKITVGIGEQTKVGPLTVFVEKCLKSRPEDTPENAAFLTVIDEKNSEKPIFKGWMFSSNPGLSAMEHPVYDIWVVECGISDSKQEEVVEANTSIPEESNSNDVIED